MAEKHAHFEGKDALSHVIEKQSEGIVASAEIHGTEIPGHISAAADAARETSIALLLLWTALFHLKTPFATIVTILSIFTCGWLFWKMGRSAWLGWSRLERLHRIMEQEKWEIEHNRPQEKEELKELYAAKGFEGKLLDDVIDVLMADNDRALRVMLKEELGLSLEVHEHPLRQGVGAAVGTLCALIFCLIGLGISPAFGIVITSFIAMGIAASVSAHYEQNRIIPAIVWNIGLGALSFGSVYFLLELFFQPR